MATCNSDLFCFGFMYSCSLLLSVSEPCKGLAAWTQSVVQDTDAVYLQVHLLPTTLPDMKVFIIFLFFSNFPI